MIVVNLWLSWSSYIHIFDIVVCAPLHSKELVILCTRYAFKRVGHSVHSVCLWSLEVMKSVVPLRTEVMKSFVALRTEHFRLYTIASWHSTVLLHSPSCSQKSRRSRDLLRIGEVQVQQHTKIMILLWPSDKQRSCLCSGLLTSWRLGVLKSWRPLQTG